MPEPQAVYQTTKPINHSLFRGSKTGAWEAVRPIAVRRHKKRGRSFGSHDFLEVNGKVFFLTRVLQLITSFTPYYSGCCFFRKKLHLVFGGLLLEGCQTVLTPPDKFSLHRTCENIAASRMLFFLSQLLPYHLITMKSQTQTLKSCMLPFIEMEAGRQFLSKKTMCQVSS